MTNHDAPELLEPFRTYLRTGTSNVVCAASSNERDKRAVVLERSLHLKTTE